MAVKSLQKLGWNLDEHKLKSELKQAGKEHLVYKKDLLEFLLQCDLSKISQPILPENISTLCSFKKPIVLQLTHWRNVSHSLVQNHQGNTGVCRLTLSDGYNNIDGFSTTPLGKLR
jgi:hypothetical protein